MAHLHRLIVALLLVACCGLSHALVPKNPGGYWWGSEPNFFPTKAQGCTSLNGGGYSNLVPDSADSDINNGWCNGIFNADGQYYAHLVNMQRQAHVAWCPTNSTEVSGGCQCVSPYVEDSTHTACVTPPTSADKWKKWCQDAAGQALGSVEAPGRGVAGGCLSGINITGSPIDTPGYQAGDVPDGGGCSFVFKDSTSHVDGVPQPGKPYNWVTEGQGFVSGGTCMAGQAPVPPDAPPGTEQAPKGDTDPCPNGYVGTVNGATVCAKQDPTKGVEGTSTGTVKNSDGTSTETKKEIKCDNGRCTIKTTETTRDVNGTIIGTSVKEEENAIGEVCNKEPGTKVCADVGMGNGQGGAGFSGNCLAGFVAKGDDPILNAMALEQYRRNCEFFEKKPDPTDETRAYDDMVAKGKQGGDQTGDLPAASRREVTIGPGDFDYSSAIASQQCFTDRSVQIMGHTLVIPLSIVCPWLEMLGNILVVVGSLLAARIVVRG